MNQKAEEQRSNQNENAIARLRHQVYNNKVIIVAGLLLFGGVVIIALGTAFIPAEKNLGYEIAHHVVRDLGIAAIISALLGSAYEYLLRGDFVDDFEDRLRKAVTEERPNFVEDAESSLRKAITDERRKLKAEFVADAETSLKQVLDNRDQFDAAGVTQIRNERSGALIQGMFETNPREVRILETWTGHRGSGASAGIASWIRATVAAGCCENVEILLLNPNSCQVGYRARALGENEDHVKRNIVSDLERLEMVRRDYEDKIEIRVYDASPSVHMFCFGDISIFGLYLWEVDSADSPQFTVRTSNGFLARKLDDHFRKLWDAEETEVWPLEEKKGPS